MRVYVSSTFEDLRGHRDAAIHALRQLGHHVVAMEDYTATEAPPLRKVLEDVQSCEAFVGIYAWRYGHVPKTNGAFVGAELNAEAFAGATPGKTSITEYEYLQAKASRLSILVFLLDEQTPWPPPLIDAFARRSGDSAIRRLRAQLKQERTVAFFATADGLKAAVGAAITTTIVRHKIRLNLVEGTEVILTPAEVDDSVARAPEPAAPRSHVEVPRRQGAQGGPAPSMVPGIFQAILDANSAGRRVITIDISSEWWSTRLYLLAVLADRLTPVRRILLVERAEEETKPSFVALLDTSDIELHLARYHPELRTYDEQLARHRVGEVGIEACVTGALTAWKDLFQIRPEHDVKELATAQSLRRWFGDGLLLTPLRIDDLERATIMDVVRLLDYPASFVPVVPHSQAGPASERKTPPGPTSRLQALPIQVVNKTALNAQLARAHVEDLLVTQNLI